MIPLIDPQTATASRMTKLRAGEDIELASFHERSHFPVTIDASQQSSDLKQRRLLRGKHNVLVHSLPTQPICVARGIAVAEDGCVSVNIANMSKRTAKIKKGTVIGAVQEIDTEEYHIIDIFEDDHYEGNDDVEYIGQGQDGLSDKDFDRLLEFIRVQYRRGLFSSNTNPGQVREDIAQHTIETKRCSIAE